MQRLRRWIKPLSATPLHPQWLLRTGRSPVVLVAQSSGRVLDVGCADRWAQSNLSKNCEYIGLDYPATGQALYKATPDIFASASALPFASSSFDTVLLLEVLEHLEQSAFALAEIRRVLKPNGRLLLTIPFLYPMHDEPHDYQRYTRYGLIRELKVAGLTLECIESSLKSASSAGLLVNLAFAGMIIEAVRQRSFAMLVTPLLLVAIPVINLSAWLVDRVMPNWSPLASGYQVLASRR